MTPERLKEIRERFNAPTDEGYTSPGCVGELLNYIDQLTADLRNAETKCATLESWLKDANDNLTRMKQANSEMAGTCGRYGEREAKLMNLAREVSCDLSGYMSTHGGPEKALDIFANVIVGTLLPDEKAGGA